MNPRDLVFRLMQCREAQESASRHLDGGLAPWTAAKLRLHLRCCWPCRRFAAQLRVLRALLRAVAETGDAASSRLSPRARERILAALREEPGTNPSDSP